MRLQNKEGGNSMLTQFPFSIYYDVAYQNGRQPYTDILNDLTNTQPPTTPVWTAKSGALTLDQETYALPQNDLPGITPLHLNENLFTAATTAVDKQRLAELVTAHLENLHSYPTNGVKQLQEAIAARQQIDPAKVVVSNGSSMLLKHIIFYLLKKNDTLLVPAPGWSYYKAAASLVSARIDTFPLLETENAFVYDKNLIAAKIEAGEPKAVLICSPNNPTGNILPLADFLWLVRKYPHVDFILDEAYYGFHTSYSAAQEKALMVSTDRQNLFVMRTLSKFYGLANLRIGFLMCSQANAQSLRKVGLVFGMPSLSQAVAVQRLTDENYGAQLQAEYTAVNAYMFTALKQITGLTPYQTRSNFMLVKHDDRWATIDDTLLKYGYKIKRETINGARNYLRITLADIATMENLLNILRQLTT